MIIHSDWHMHSEASYDASLTLDDIAAGAARFGFRKMGVTDHVNFNDRKFMANLEKSAESVNAYKKKFPDIVSGVELTPIAKAEFDYIAGTGTRDGYIPAGSMKNDGIELGSTKENLIRLGVQYAIGAAHWRLDVTNDDPSAFDLRDSINEWYRLQMWLANDERVTILGHPWWNSKGLWYEDFSVIPHSMHMDIAAALKENGKYVECNSHFFRSNKATEKFKHQYAEFLRELFEMGVPVTFGSDSHFEYVGYHLKVEDYLLAAGFKDGDISELDERVLW
ncbi:MAG: PHP domain-containing protein [Clostridia bacterium]|nr:PHP domain-containing protein [Clostridia bacterium]